jgi:hypothetical protein
MWQLHFELRICQLFWNNSIFKFTLEYLLEHWYKQRLYFLDMLDRKSEGSKWYISLGPRYSRLRDIQ